MRPEAATRRRSRARLLLKIFEVDPLPCPQRNVEMRPVAVLSRTRQFAPNSDMGGSVIRAKRQPRRDMVA